MKMGEPEVIVTVQATTKSTGVMTPNRSTSNLTPNRTTSTLNSNKSPSTSAPIRRSYSATVSDQELDFMRLTASVCRTVNGRMRKNYLKFYGKQKHIDFRNVMRANDAFFVKTGHERFYGSTLMFPRDVTLKPTSLCPDVTAHDINVLEYSLPLACPTCWSVQRNGLSNLIDTKIEKRRIKKSPKGRPTVKQMS